MTITADRVFDEAIAYISAWTGIDLPETKYRPLREYLDGYPQGTAFGDIVCELERSAEERERFLSVVTINETYFFREQKQFAVLRDRILPAIRERGGRFVAWSAACSSGEEAVSIAALAASVLEPSRVSVYAGDINTAALARCEEGRYGPNSFREDGREFASLLEGWVITEDRDAVVSGPLKSLIRYAPLNLAGADYPGVPHGLDVVFLRNALMYMPMETRLSVVGRVAERLAEGGSLFFSSTEIPHLSHPDLALQEEGGVYFFRKKSAAEKSQGAKVTESTFRPLSAQAIALPSLGTGGARADGGSACETAREEGRGPRLVTAAEAARCATQRLNNPLFEEPSLPAFRAALLYLEAVYRLGNGGDAGAVIREAESAWGANALTWYLFGMAAAASSREDPAAYRAALADDPSFWPARLRLAMLLRERQSREALGEFARCAADIESYLAEGRYEYQCILEGFNAKYFLDLCRGWVRKLGSEGADHGPR
ncbi:MAG: hypothetical protein JXM71_01855 [Spirochaetales bacterium]|nr:hypothetical protein [Spirochaetales bacterium]